MINFIKRDFMMIRASLGYLVNREIPFGIAVLYYVIVGLIALPFMPFMWLATKIYLWRLKKQCENWIGDVRNYERN